MGRKCKTFVKWILGKEVILIFEMFALIMLINNMLIKLIWCNSFNIGFLRKSMANFQIFRMGNQRFFI